MLATLTGEQMKALREVDSCLLADALGMLRVRLRNESYSKSHKRDGSIEGMGRIRQRGFSLGHSGWDPRLPRNPQGVAS